MNSTLRMEDLKISNKNKRRSKNDIKDRNYKCGCGKKYLSYPALYTHIKQKHDGVDPPGTQSTQLKSGRGRGRPRKIFVADEIAHNSDMEESKDEDQFNEDQYRLISIFTNEDPRSSNYDITLLSKLFLLKLSIIFIDIKILNNLFYKIINLNLFLFKQNLLMI